MNEQEILDKQTFLQVNTTLVNICSPEKNSVWFTKRCNFWEDQ